ncbi:nicotinate-nucleotide--dimethylbenzimidazole phosphoribosyltransferase [Cloacibacillus sp.]|uniref:nicotinate-nucleotide--dimethylbenzimidazole phosphoribosyltransferase n=1 Tax=Cloacibacillus sp. TaxID=2049023 RepID=UPI0025B8F43F|nr:TIGR00303 family protein [Cloacibacillus sp.]MCC8057766.1 TIGR00303 family protein [Cloacibacillus sp.]
MFLLFISETALAKIPGLSAAGANLDALPYTAPADADMLFYDRPKVAASLPFDPFGHPSPALVTRAALLTAGFDAATVRVGTSIAPASPHETISEDIGRDMRFEAAVPGYEEIARRSAALAAGLDKNIKQVVLAESVPGGTTTALLVLRALGHVGTVSSAGPENPLPLKEQIWRDTAKRLGIKEGGMKGFGLRAAAELGDPMQVAVAAYAAALPGEVQITLAGGTQMMAVAALLRDMGVDRDILVATTKYVHIDPTSCLEEYAAKIGVRWYAAPLDFTNSRFPGLADYEKGFIKEGVGAGGAVWYAQQLGVSMEGIQSRTEALYEKMLDEG